MVFTLQWFLTEKFKLPKYRASMNDRTKALKFSSDLYKPPEDRDKEDTEVLDKSSRYYLLGANQEEKQEPPSPGIMSLSDSDDSRQSSLRPSYIASNNVTRKTGKKNPYASASQSSMNASKRIGNSSMDASSLDEEI